MSAAKDILRSFLLKNNIYLSKATELSLLEDFFNSIKPINTDRELIRLGGESDGGYLIPDDLQGIDVCFSPGVSGVADFELDLTRIGIKCFLADASVEAPPVASPLFDFEKKYLGLKDGDLFMTLENWVKRKAQDKNDFILQMDIEGSEYAVILNTSDEILSRFRIMVIEFHNLGCICSWAGLELVRLTFAKLLKDFEIVHIHPNNCSRPINFQKFEIPPILEFTFLRKDRISKKSPCSEFPHKLDRKNVPKTKDLVLPKCWYV